MTPSDTLVIYGASGSAREVASWVRYLPSFDFVGHIDDERPNRNVGGMPVWSLNEAAQRHPGASVFLAVGDPGLREKLFERAVAVGFVASPPLVHPAASLDSESIHLGAGCLVCAGAVLTCDIKVGAHVHINVACSVSHDVTLDDFSTLSPGVHIPGKVHVGRGAFLGTGAVAVDGEYERPLYIGAGSIIGAGAVVTKDVPPGETWAGVPAKPVSRG